MYGMVYVFANIIISTFLPRAVWDDDLSRDQIDDLTDIANIKH